MTVSINNKITLFEYFGSVPKQGWIVCPKQLNKIMLKWNAQNMDGDEAKDVLFMKEIKDLPVQDASDYDTKAMREDRVGPAPPEAVPRLPEGHAQVRQKGRGRRGNDVPRQGVGDRRPQGAHLHRVYGHRRIRQGVP